MNKKQLVLGLMAAFAQAVCSLLVTIVILLSRIRIRLKETM